MGRIKQILTARQEARHQQAQTANDDEGTVTDMRRTNVNGSPFGTIEWSEHEEAYVDYARRYGRRQSAERIAERGGFGWGELVTQLGHQPRTWMPDSRTRPRDLAYANAMRAA